MNHIQILQEDLRWQEQFIGEIAKYDRELADWVLEGMATGDEEVMNLLEQMGLIKAMGAGARAGDAAMKGLGFSGKVSDFLGLRAPGKVAGALGAGAIYTGKKLVGGGKGTEKKKEQPAKPAMGERIKGAVDSLRGNAPSSSGGGAGGGASVNVNVTNNNTNTNTNTNTMGSRDSGAASTERRSRSSTKPAPPPVNDTSTSKEPAVKKQRNVDTSTPVHPREKARMDAERGSKKLTTAMSGVGAFTGEGGGKRTPLGAGGGSVDTGFKRVSGDSARVVNTAEKLTDSGTTAKGTVARTATNVAAAKVSDDAGKLDAATSNTFMQRVKNAAGKVKGALTAAGGPLASRGREGAGSPEAQRATAAAKARNTDPNRPMSSADERRVAGATLKMKPTMGTRPADAPLTDPEKRRVAGSAIGREATTTAIRNADARAARATVGRAATNIAARGVKASPESVGAASTVSGEMRDSGASPKDAAKAVTSAVRKPSARRGGSPSMMTASGRADRSERKAAEAEASRQSRRERISAMASRRRQTGGNPSAGLRTTATGTGTFSPGARRPGKGASGTQMGLFGG